MKTNFTFNSLCACTAIGAVALAGYFYYQYQKLYDNFMLYAKISDIEHEFLVKILDEQQAKKDDESSH